MDHRTIHELVPNGCEILVDDENKYEYAQKVTETILVNHIKPQL